jgi:hypothetical protein
MNACNNKKGQVAFILILLTAAALIFYASTINLSKVGDTKTITIMAANTGASLMASQMSSYAQSLVMEYLRGKLEYCKSTSIIGAIITLIVAIIIAVITYGTGVYLVLAVMAVVLSAVSLAVNIMVIQPGITNMWNRMTASTMVMEDQFLEGGVRTALQTAVNDTTEVPDLYDYDTDRAWGWDAATGMPNDTITRYAFYYTKRLKEVELPDLSPVTTFLDALKEFVYSETDGWGLYDQLDCSSNPAHSCCQMPPLSECNPCCLPVDERPECCSDGSCGDPNSCDDAVISPYLNANGDESYEYKWIYDPIMEDGTNGFVSFLEGLGRDDSTQVYTKNLPTDIEQMYTPADPEFKPIDATGVVHPGLHKWKFWGTDLTTIDFTDPLSPDEHDYWTENGCANVNMPPELQAPCLTYQYPWGAGNIDSQSFATVTTNDYVDSLNDNVANQPPLAPDMVAIATTDRVLAEPGDCADNPLPPDYNFYDTNFNDTSYMAGLGTGFWKEGSDYLCNTGDMVSNPLWPYSESCAREGGSTCFENITTWWDAAGDPIDPPVVEQVQVACPCGSPGTDPTQWYDDITNEWRTGVAEFVGWALNILDQYESDPNGTRNNYAAWYESAAEWIEPRVEEYDVTAAGVIGPDNDVWDYYSENYDRCWTTNPETGDYIPGTSGPCCYVCGQFGYDANNIRYLLPDEAPYHGVLQTWIEEISYARRNLEGLLDKSFAGTSCYEPTATPQSEVWCVPPTEVGGVTCPVKNTDEEATFDSNGNGIVGDIEDVIACLDWNANDTTGLGAVPALFSSNPAVFKGNWAKFYECRYSCSDANCEDLPRSLVPGFDDVPYFPNAPADAILLQACQTSANVFYCNELCSSPTPISQAIYDTYEIPAWDAPTITLNSAVSGSAFYNGLIYRINSPVYTAMFPGIIPTLQTCVNAIDAGVLTTIINQCGSIVWPANYTWNGACRTTSVFYAQVLNRIASPLLDLVERPALIQCRDSIAAIGVGPATAVQLNNCITQCDYDTAAGIRVAGPPLANPAWTNLAIPWREPVAATWIAPVVTDPGSCSWLTGGDTTFKDAIDEAVIEAGGSCIDPVFLGGVQQSMYEAMVQGRKFEQRRLFLTNRLTELNNAIQFLQTAEDRFTAFYTGPVEDFIKFRMREDEESRGLKGQAVYGWQTTPARSSDTGAWHVVRVDARTPGRCKTCNPSQTSTQPFPSVKTKTKNWGTKRCYYLINYSGITKVRVTRYDEDRGAAGILTFPNGSPLWDFRFVHPLRGSVDTSSIAEACANVMEPNPVGAYATPVAYFGELHPQFFSSSEGTYRIYGGGFMMNEYIPEFDPVTGDPNPDENEDCWKRATELLGYGVTTETCAQYYWGGAGRMQVKFVPCHTW